MEIVSISAETIPHISTNKLLELTRRNPLDRATTMAIAAELKQRSRLNAERASRGQQCPLCGHCTTDEPFPSDTKPYVTLLSPSVKVGV